MKGSAIALHSCLNHCSPAEGSPIHTCCSTTAVLPSSSGTGGQHIMNIGQASTGSCTQMIDNTSAQHYKVTSVSSGGGGTSCALLQDSITAVVVVVAQEPRTTCSQHAQCTCHDSKDKSSSKITACTRCAAAESAKHVQREQVKQAWALLTVPSLTSLR